MANHEYFWSLLPKLPFVSPSGPAKSYLEDIFDNRDDLSTLVGVGHFLPGAAEVVDARAGHRAMMEDQQRKVLWVAVKDVIRGLGLEQTPYEVAVLYQARTKTGKVLEGDEDVRLRIGTSRTLESLPSLLNPDDFTPYDKDVLFRLTKETGQSHLEILARSVEVRFDKNPANLHSIRLSVKAGEKLYKKMTEVLFEQRKEPVVDALRLRLLIDSDAYAVKGADVEQAHRLFYSLFPNKPAVTRQLPMRSQYDTACILPQELGKEKNSLYQSLLFTDRQSLLQSFNLRRQLDPSFDREPGSGGFFSKDQSPRFRDQYQFLKTGFILRGSDLNLDHRLVEPALIGSYCPALEVQVTTSDRHRRNEASSAQTTKSRYVLYDLAKTMVSTWNQASYDIFSNLSKANPFGTMYDGEIPAGSDFHTLQEQADIIWRDIIPKLQGVEHDLLEKEVKKALHRHPDLKKYCC